MRPDLNEFIHHLDGMDMTEEQKTEYIEMLWRITEEFVDYGFGTHPVQQAQSSRAKGDDGISEVVSEFIKREGLDGDGRRE